VALKDSRTNAQLFKIFEPLLLWIFRKYLYE